MGLAFFVLLPAWKKYLKGLNKSIFKSAGYSFLINFFLLCPARVYHPD